MADVTITWLGHSTFTVELADGKVLLIDPWLEGNPSHPKGHQLERVDVMLDDPWACGPLCRRDFSREEVQPDGRRDL